MTPSNLKIWLVTGLISLALPLTAQETPQDKQFEQMLIAIDTVPSRDTLDLRWPDASLRLCAASVETNRNSWSRQRAISLLSLYPTKDVRDHLVILTSAPDPNIRKTAVYTLGRTFGASGDAKLVKHITSVALSDISPAVQDRAVRTLRWISHPNALTALKAIASTRPELAPLVSYVIRRKQHR